MERTEKISNVGVPIGTDGIRPLLLPVNQAPYKH